LLDHVIYDLEVVRDQVWIGTDIGAYRLSLATGKLQKYQDPDRLLFNRVFDITSADRYLWLSSDGGAVQIDLDSGSTRPYRISSRLIGDRAIAANDRIAAIASDLGVTIIFMDDEHWNSRELSTFDGLLSPYVFGLILDGDFLWVGTDMGLTRINWSNPRLRP
jgi:ligand-binding sensor domain-containing protein